MGAVRRAAIVDQRCRCLRWRGLDLSAMVTHRYRLDEWGKAFVAIHDKNGSHLVKASFTFD